MFFSAANIYISHRKAIALFGPIFQQDTCICANTTWIVYMAQEPY